MVAKGQKKAVQNERCSGQIVKKLLAFLRAPSPQTHTPLGFLLK